MPYIRPSTRKQLEVDRGFQHPYTIENPGELNYLITELVKVYMTTNHGYQAINDVVGALEGAKLEFYRRIAAPYEDLKIADNGDVY